MKRELTNAQTIERSTIKKYRKELWNPFIAAVKRYELIQENDKVAVCVSGGKDSWLLAVLMKHLQTHSEVPFELKFISMDPGYNKENRQLIEKNAKLFDIPLKIFETDIFSTVDKTEKNPCYLCARMRRGHLYSKAKELGCNKIALGHHMSDVIETTVLAMLYGSQLQAMPPKLHSTNFEGMELIRPLYCVNEEDIIKWRDYNNLNFLNCACKFAKEKEEDSKREEIKQLIKDLKETNPNIENSIFSSIHNLHFDTFPAYRTKGEDHTFLENYYT
ncbi:MAG: tRNA 2-thiocytidine biosynthesis protein TtcA [Ruminococcaceae bacterium]|nr:tRNA 2-thiocytidine biosynthesis protein TtcA [Oscillospiraceae bacterium]